MIKQCAICGKTINVERNGRYCSDKCRHIGLKMSYTRHNHKVASQKMKDISKEIKCSFCGGAFTPEHPNQIYCKECIRQATESKKAKTVKIAVIYHRYCKCCGKEFDTHKKNVKFCSTECLRTYFRNTSEYNSDYYKKKTFLKRHNGNPERECIVCGNTFIPNKHFRKVCCEECRKKNQNRNAEAVRIRQSNKSLRKRTFDLLKDIKKYITDPEILVRMTEIQLELSAKKHRN